MVSSVLLLFLAIAPNAFFNTDAIGVNYGTNGDNLPSPSQVVNLIKSLPANIDRVKIFDANQDILRAFASSGLKMAVAVPNNQVSNLASNAQAAADWVTSNVKPWSNIDTILVGNEDLQSSTVPAMKNIKSGLDSNNLGTIMVSTALSYDIVQNTYPPSQGVFSRDITSLLEFLSSTRSFFMINPYPYLAWRDGKATIPLEYALFNGQNDVDNLRYTSLLDAQVDAVYAALEKAGYESLSVQIGETGWPSAGGDGATADNARNYNTRLIKKINGNNGTPKRPSNPITTYIFALFNENQKDGAEIEKHWGLLNADGSPAYSLN